MPQRDWKTVALVSIGFSAGMAYAVACGDDRPMAAHASEQDSGDVVASESDTQDGETDPQDSETGAQDTTSPPAASAKSRAVVEVYFGLDPSGSSYSCGHTNNEFVIDSDTFDVAAMQAACCPDGFTAVGWSSHVDYTYWPLVCLEDA